MDEDQFIVLAKKVNDVDEKVSRLDRDMADDRNSMGAFQVRLGAVEAQQKQTLESLHTIDKRIKDGIRDGVEAAMKPVLKQMGEMQLQLDEFTQKKVLVKTINVNPLVQWWKRLRG